MILKYFSNRLLFLNKLKDFYARKKRKFIKDSILKNNRILKNRYQNQKCYLLGNSPSLNNHDLLLLETENVFCLNTFFVHKDFNKIKPNFYVFADPDLYILNDSNKDWWMKLIEKASNKGICFFLPLQLKHTFVHRNLINEKIYFIDFSLRFNKESVKNFDLSVPINGVQNVLILSIQIAIFLGFKEIYLLGADHDWLNHFGNEQRHFYDTKETKVENVGADNYPYHWWLNSVNTMFIQYKLIKNHVDNEKKIKIFNASESGVLDIFPLITYKDSFENDKKDI
jgi:hypothetical protein